MKTSDKQITMKEIGRRAGVSQQAVSLVLNNKATNRVGKTTRDKVMKLVRELNYTPNVQARSLASGKTGTIAVAGTATLSEMSTLIPSRIFSGIGSVATTRNNTLHFLPLHGEGSDRGLVGMMRGRVADGLIIVVYSQMEKHFIRETRALLHEAAIPYVAVTSTMTKLGCPQVAYDAVTAGSLAAAHLADRGAQRITFINYPERSYHQQLAAGCRATAASLNTPVDEVSLTAASYRDTADYGYEEGKKIIAAHGVQDAYLVFSDAFAMGFIDTLEEAGAHVPDDVMVMGCDDLYPEQILRSKLTALNRKPEEAGARAAEMLFGAMDKTGSEENPLVVIQPELVLRKSTDRKNHK